MRVLRGSGSFCKSSLRSFFVLALVRASEPHVRQGFERFVSSLDYKPIVDVRKVKPNQRKAKNEMDLRGAIVETAKYPTKPIEKMGKTEEQKLKVTDDLMKALKNKRQIGFGGLFKEIRKELQLEDVENGDLVHVDEDNDDTTLGTEIVAIWNWERKNYFV